MVRYFFSIIGIAAALVLAAGPARAQDIALPEFSPDARKGGVLFMSKCASCHGYYAQGTKKGPPLLHQYYRPGHHSDRSFWAAIRNGARQHHWSFGDMKPVEGVVDDQVPLIIQYVRELQKANNIL
jgi:cytochrome c2